jgi:ATP-dependent helicase/nuclease subunit A
LTHFAMQHINPDRIKKLGVCGAGSHIPPGEGRKKLAEEINRQLVEMVGMELYTENEVKVIYTDKIAGFFLSGLGNRLLSSSSVYREVPFTLGLKASEIYRDLVDCPGRDEFILLQGIIDCFFEEAGGLVLLDYKTDYVPEGRSQIIAERYKLQLGYYARALEEITGKSVFEKHIYLFSNGESLLIQ